jgi:hypothetical protein
MVLRPAELKLVVGPLKLLLGGLLAVL